VEVWTRSLSGGAKAILVLNAGSDRTANHPFHLDLARLGLHGPLKGKDLWTGKDITVTNNMPVELVSHDTLLLRNWRGEVNSASRRPYPGHGRRLTDV